LGQNVRRGQDTQKALSRQNAQKAELGQNAQKSELRQNVQKVPWIKYQDVFVRTKCPIGFTGTERL